MAKLADAADLKSVGPFGPWGFDPLSRHQESTPTDRLSIGGLGARSAGFHLRLPHASERHGDVVGPAGRVGGIDQGGGGGV